MTILRFTARRSGAPRIAQRLATLESLLADWRGRQADLREEGQRLLASVRRLRALTRTMIRSQRRLGQSLGRLRSCHRAFGPPGPD
jgi:hypothetical protein